MNCTFIALSLAVTAIGAVAGEPVATQWSRSAEGCSKHRQGSVLVWAADLKKFLLVGDGVAAFDPADGSWAELSTSKPEPKGDFNPYYQAAYDEKSRKLFCLSNGSVLYVFDVEAKTWKVNPSEPLLEGLSWHMLACDGQGRLVAVGSDKKVDNVGWTRTLVYDVASGQWSPLPHPPDDAVKKHRDLVEATERVIDLVGYTRLAWYRDPKGIGTDDELKALVERIDTLGKLPALATFKDDLAKIAELIRGKTTLDALKVTRALQRKIEDAAFDQYAVPRSRRNAPLVYDAKDKVFVLFGGDHEDYQLNDTWTLDLEKKAWKRMNPGLAPAPRAGHAAVYLPTSGRVAVYEGYVPSESSDYSAQPWTPLAPRDLWLYDVKTDRWDLAGVWDGKGSNPAAVPPMVGKFYGYSASWYEVPPLAADAADRVVLAVPGSKNDKASVWTLAVDPAKPDPDGREKLGRQAGERRLRALCFRADFSEVPDDPKPKDLATLPANQWVQLTPAPRTPAHGCRQRDWSTTTWDSDRDQVLMWGGGHCVRSSSVPLHYSPVANRIVEGYDAEEPYCYNGWCGPASSLLNKQWIDTHAYHLYAYDPHVQTAGHRARLSL